MATSDSVLVCGEMADGKIGIVTRELLAMGRRLADSLHLPLHILLIGKDIHKAGEEAVTLGADRAYVVDGLPFAESHPDIYTAVIAKVCQQSGPSIVLMGQTDMGRDVAPRLAVRLGTVVTMDCTDLAIDADTKCLLQTKPVYGGNALAVWASEPYKPQIATLRPRSVMPAEPDASRKGEITTLSIAVNDAMVKGRLVEAVREETRGIKLEEAKAIVAGGGGIGGRDGFKLLEELAKVVGGAVGVSRVPCDEGWMPISLEIGQTGHIVSPNLYIAIGISGAPQHMAGCSGSKCIVAINRDAEAQIFKVSDFGVVGDYKEALPALISRCRELLK